MCVCTTAHHNCCDTRSPSLLRFDTRIGGLTFTEQFLSISTALPSKNAYGLRENAHDSFRHVMDGSVWRLFSRDEGPVPQFLRVRSIRLVRVLHYPCYVLAGVLKGVTLTTAVCKASHISNRVR
ncbi:maltase-glucoamylase, intestinal-like isoform X1 [Portunus trituberculatus]|uniref:maltase-glucoamylase, intestinal-like isoform X1 n=1 Tax=Portunus trituberculatus TaxID=210409 RepID=UPI001E1CB9AB|nr:maltase-glucoamylase, intestinal-like isoform X1 [Portunus trituberculatus]